MARIIEYTTGKYKVETVVVTRERHSLHVDDNERVGITDKSDSRYINRGLEHYSDWNLNGVPYTSLTDLINDLNTFFFDVEYPYPEVDTRNDLPFNVGIPATGIIYIVKFPVTETFLGVPYKTYQSGWYIRDTQNGNLNDWRRLNIKTQFTTSELEIHDGTDQSKFFGFVASLLSSGVKRSLTVQDKDYVIADNADAIGSVTVHSDVSSSGSGQIITPQERTDINASIDVHSDIQLSGVALLVNTLLKYNGSNFIACLHQIVRSSVLVINNTSTLQDKINVNINVQRLVVHKIVVSFSWSLNDGGQDLVAVASFGGQNLMIALTNNTEIFRQEPKDTGGADPDGRGTNQRQSFHRTFFVTPTSAGNNALILQFAGSANGDLASMWEASIEVEELISITGT